MQFELLKSFILKSIIRTNTEILSPYATSPIDQVEKKLNGRKYRKCKLQIDVCLDPEKNGSVASASRLGQLKMFFLPKCIFYRGFLNTVFKILYLSNILLMPHKKKLDGSASRHMPLKVYFQNWICQKCIFQQVWWWPRKESSVAAFRLGKLKEFSFLFKNVFSTSLMVTQKKELGGSLQTRIIERVAAAPLPPQQNLLFSSSYFVFL